MTLVSAGKRRSFVRIEKPVADASFDGAGSGTWELHEEAWAEVQDTLPSRGERLAEGVKVTEGPARIRLPFIPGVTSRMRIVDVDRDRTFQIVGRPAEIGHGEGLEVMAVEFTPSGNGA